MGGGVHRLCPRVDTPFIEADDTIKKKANRANRKGMNRLIVRICISLQGHMHTQGIVFEQAIEDS